MKKYEVVFVRAFGYVVDAESDAAAEAKAYGYFKIDARTTKYDDLIIECMGEEEKA